MRQSTGICLYVRKTGLFEMNCGRSRTRSCELHHRHHHHIVSISMPASASSRYVPIFARMQPPAVVVSRMLRTHFCTTRILRLDLTQCKAIDGFFFCFFFCYFCWMKCLFALYYIRDTIFIRFFFLLRAHNIESKYKRCPFFSSLFSICYDGTMVLRYEWPDRSRQHDDAPRKKEVIILHRHTHDCTHGLFIPLRFHS